MQPVYICIFWSGFSSLLNELFQNWKIVYLILLKPNFLTGVDFSDVRMQYCLDFSLLVFILRIFSSTKTETEFIYKSISAVMFLLKNTY